MKGETVQKQEEELSKAKDSQRRFSREARVLSHEDFAQFLRDPENFFKLMEKKGFVVSNKPMGDR